MSLPFQGKIFPTEFHILRSTPLLVLLLYAVYGAESDWLRGIFLFFAGVCLVYPKYEFPDWLICLHFHWPILLTLTHPHQLYDRIIALLFPK